MATIVMMPLAAQAQKLEPGTWTGSITPPGQDAFPVTYDVAMAGDTVKISMNAQQHGTFKFDNVKLASGKLTFTWQTPGPVLDCALEAKPDNSYSGICSIGGQDPGTMVMIPPKKSAP